MSGAEEFRIRPMQAGDLPRVMEIERGLKDAPHWSRVTWEAVMAPAAVRPRVAVVAEVTEASSVVGFAVGAVAGPEAELESIGVAGEWQRRGVARQMFRSLAGELRRAGVRELFLEVRASNQAAVGLYGSLGFAEAGLRARYYSDPEEDAVLMRLRLG
jgi:ribosomal-protein-alanine N-acetyltransferase